MLPKIKKNILIFFLINFSFFAVGQSKKIDSLKSEYNNTKIDSIKIRLLNEIAWGIRYSDPKGSIENCKKALSFQKIPRLYIGISNHTMGVALSIQGNFNESLRTHKIALKIFKELNDYKRIVSSQINIAYNYERLGKLKESIIQYQSSLITATEKNIDEYTPIIHTNLGIAYKVIGMYKEAITQYLKALRGWEHLNSDASIAVIENNLGNIYHSLGDYDKSLEYYLKAIERRKKINDTIRIAEPYMNAGNEYIKKGQYKLGEKYLTKAFNIWKNRNETRLADAYESYGTLYFEKKDFAKAYDFHQKALELRKKTGYKRGQVSSLINIAENLTKAKSNSKEIITLLNKALAISQDIDFLEGIRRVYLAKSKSYERQKNYIKALQLYKKHIQIKDSLSDIDKIKAVENLNIIHETEKKEQQITLQKAELDTKTINPTSLKRYREIN